MAGADTQAVDNGSVDSIVNDVNEMAMGWYSAVTGKGVARGPGYVVGVESGTTLHDVAAADSIIETPPIVQVVQSPLVLAALVAAVVVLVVLVVK